MATLIPKPKSLFSYHLSKNKKLLLLILLALLLLIGLVLGALTIHKELRKIHRLRHDLSQTQFTLSQYRHQISQLSSEDDLRISKLQQALTDSQAKFQNQEEEIRKLHYLLKHKPVHPGLGEVNLLQELRINQDMLIKAQQKIDSYDQQLEALRQEMKYYKEQNQLIRQEQAKIRAEHQELLNQRPQVSQEQPLRRPLESRLSQLANTDYELEQKLKDVQRAVESCAKIGELKALEVYYDDKLDNLSHMIQKSNNSGRRNSSETEQFKQLKQDLTKLFQQEEGIKAAFNQLGEYQKAHEARLKALENQGHLNISNPSHRPVNISVQSPHELLKEAVENYNRLSKSGHNKKELKEAKKQIKELHHQINQQPEEIYRNIQQNATKQNKSQGTQTEQVRIPESETFSENQFERELGNDIANIINAFVDLYNDL